MAVGGKISAVDWEEILKNEAVTEVTTMALPNNARRHDAETDERLFLNLRTRAPRLKRLLSLSMAEVNGRKH